MSSKSRRSEIVEEDKQRSRNRRRRFAMLPIVLACAALTLPHRPMPSLERAHLAAPLAARPARAGSPLMADPWAASSGGIDWNTVLGVGVALSGIFGGIALISFTENAGKRNEELANAQPCVECKGEKVRRLAVRQRLAPPPKRGRGAAGNGGCWRRGSGGLEECVGCRLLHSVSSRHPSSFQLASPRHPPPPPPQPVSPRPHPPTPLTGSRVHDLQGLGRRPTRLPGPRCKPIPFPPRDKKTTFKHNSHAPPEPQGRSSRAPEFCFKDVWPAGTDDAPLN